MIFLFDHISLDDSEHTPAIRPPRFDRTAISCLLFNCWASNASFCETLEDSNWNELYKSKRVGNANIYEKNEKKSGVKSITTRAGGEL